MSQYKANTTDQRFGLDNKGLNDHDNDPHHSFSQTIGIGSGHKQSHPSKNISIATPYGGSSTLTSSSQDNLTTSRNTTTGDKFVSGSSAYQHEDDRHLGIGSKISNKLGMGYEDKFKESSGSPEKLSYQSEHISIATPYGGSSTPNSRGQDNLTGHRTTTDTDGNYSSDANSQKRDDDKHVSIGSKIAHKLGLGHHGKPTELMSGSPNGLSYQSEN